VTPGAVSQWLKRARDEGVEALRRHPAPGPRAKLAAEQLAQIPALLARGPEAYGLRGQRWTCKRVAEVIWRAFAGQVPPRPCQPAAPRQGAECPASRRTGDPAQRAGDPGLVAGALARPRKKAAAKGRTIVWVDQSGFYRLPLVPLVVRTWAPCGQTPVLRVPLTRDHLAAIGGLTPDRRLFLQTQAQAYRSPDVVRFLRLLLRKISGKLLVIWDGAPHSSGPAD
jgi:hypothetical protein